LWLRPPSFLRIWASSSWNSSLTMV
jgi:hypothetical protein